MVSKILIPLKSTINIHVSLYHRSLCLKITANILCSYYQKCVHAFTVHLASHHGLIHLLYSCSSCFLLARYRPNSGQIHYYNFQ